jgi:hypothetical protein
LRQAPAQIFNINIFQRLTVKRSLLHQLFAAQSGTPSDEPCTGLATERGGSCKPLQLTMCQYVASIGYWPSRNNRSLKPERPR